MAKSAKNFHPKALLLPYQAESANDPSRFIFDLWSRQTGKDFTATEAVVEDSYRTAKNNWLIAAPSERQSLKTLAKAKEWCEAYRYAIEDATEERESGPQSLLKASTIVLGNGSRIIAVPGRPETVRGFSANVLLTEFAFFEKVDETWRALLPSITNPLRGGLKKVRAITTPNGKGDMVWRIWEKNFVSPDPARKQKWSCRKVTIHDAVRAGLPVDIEELREAMDDPDGFAQEFECEFLDSSNVLLPYELIALAETAGASEVIDPEFFKRGSSPVFLGIDFGRSNDPTVAYTLESVGDLLITREVCALRGMSTVDQQAMLESRIQRASRVCYDYTGPGIGLGDHLVRRHGEWNPEKHMYGKIELCTFTVGFKREIFPKLRRQFEAPTKLRVPVSKECREDFHAMRQVVRNGEYTYSAPRTAEGHSDRCTALALAVRAAGDGASAVLPPMPFPRTHPERQVTA